LASEKVQQNENVMPNFLTGLAYEGERFCRDELENK